MRSTNSGIPPSVSGRSASSSKAGTTTATRVPSSIRRGAPAARGGPKRELLANGEAVERDRVLLLERERDHRVQVRKRDELVRAGDRLVLEHARLRRARRVEPVGDRLQLRV